jgi:hypothetical protein
MAASPSLDFLKRGRSRKRDLFKQRKVDCRNSGKFYRAEGSDSIAKHRVNICLQRNLKCESSR